jgi:hypothetical protein
MEISMEVPHKTKKDLPRDPSIPLLGIYLKEYKVIYMRDTCILMLIAGLFTIANCGISQDA